jgi:hypothetical protein
MRTPWLMLLRAWMGAKALALARDDHLEAAVHQRALGEQPLAFDGDPRVGVLGDVLRAVVEAGPGRRHGVGVDVVHQVLDPQVFHAQVELAAQLAADLLRVPGEEQDALSGREGDRLAGLHECGHELFI